MGFPRAQMVKNPPAVYETRVRSLGQEDPLRTEWNGMQCNALESSQNHPPPQSVEKLSSTKSVPGAIEVGDC